MLRFLKKNSAEREGAALSPKDLNKDVTEAGGCCMIHDRKYVHEFVTHMWLRSLGTLNG